MANADDETAARTAVQATNAARGPTPGTVPSAGAANSATTAPDAGATSQISVLVVDDDAAARRAITTILRLRSFKVTEAGTVAEAVGRLRDSPDWILLDLMLPDGSGCTVLERVAATGCRSRVCVISGAGPAMIDNARLLGPQHVLRKPLDVPRLLAILART